MVAQIRFDVGASVGTAGEARNDATPNTLITINSVGAGTTHALELLDTTQDPAPTIANPTSTTWTFTTPTGEYHSYRFKLDVDGDVEIRTLRVPLPNGTLLPTFGERADPLSTLASPNADASEDNEGGNYRGWAQHMQAALRELDALIGGGGGSTYAKFADDATALFQFDFEDNLTDNRGLLTLTPSATSDYLTVNGLRGLLFEKTYGIADATNRPELKLYQDLTIAILYQSPGGPGTERDLIYFETAGAQYYAALKYGVSGGGWTSYDSTNLFQVSAQTGLENVPHLFVMTRTSGVDIRFYIDGVLTNTFAVSALSDIGDAHVIIGPGVGQFRGMLFQMKVLTTALSGAQVLALAQECGVAP